MDYIPISKSFKAPKCVIKARDPRLHRINVATLGFLTPNPLQEGTLTTTPIPKGIPKVALPLQCAAEEEATSSQPPINEQEEIIEVLNIEDSEDFKDFEDDFEVFNQPLSPEVLTGDLGLPSPAQSSHNQEVANTSSDMGI